MTGRYSALAVDQSMTSTGLAHLFAGDKEPTGWLFPMPSWGDDEGRYLNDFRYHLKDKLWDLQVTNLFFENTFFNHLDHHETMTQTIASVGLVAAILMVADDCKRAGQEIEVMYIDNAQWTEQFWGSSKAPRGLTKGQRQKWRKEQSIRQCDLRGWGCEHDGRPNHNIADAKGLLSFGVGSIDLRWAANSVPLFNRASMARENEERELR